MSTEEREQQRQEREERRRMEEERRLLREIRRSPEHPLGRLYRNVEKHKEHLLNDEQELIEREAELERFQPTIRENETKKPPHITYF